MMKKIIIILLFIACIFRVQAQNPIDHRGYIRMFYGTDTLDIMFSSDTNLFTGSLSFFKMSGGFIIDSLKLGDVWYSSFLTPSTNIDLSDAPNGAMLFEMNDTIGWVSGLTAASAIISSLGLNIESVSGNLITTTTDTNRITHTGSNGVVMLEAMGTGGKVIMNSKYRSEMATDDTTRAYVDANGLHAVAEFYVRDTSLITLINIHSLANPIVDSSWYEADIDTLNVYRIDFGDIELTGSGNQFVVSMANVNYYFFVERDGTGSSTIVHTGGYLMITPNDSWSSRSSNAQKGWLYTPTDRDSLYWYNGTDWECLNCGGIGLESYPAVGDTGLVAVANDESAFFIDVEKLPYEIDTLQTAELDSVMVNDTMYIHTVESQRVNSDTVDVNVLIYDGLEAVGLRSIMTDITSANILNGDSLLILSAPGAGKAYVITDVNVYLIYNSITYVNGSNSYVRTFEGTNIVDIIRVGEAAFKRAASRVTVKEGAQSGDIVRYVDYYSLNQPVWFHIVDGGTAFITGNSTAKIVIEYKILDFN